ncbi:hypothetical protein pb186bvf_017866 [Paramecium bursaria]
MHLNKIFFPAPKPSYDKVSIALLPQTELIFIESEKNDSWLKCAPTIRKVPVLLVKNTTQTSKYILYFHSNSEDIFICYQYFQPLLNMDVNLILVEYPGYGIYKGHSACADTVSEDAIAVYQYFINMRKIKPTNITVMGRSMGTGPACLIASQFKPAALILISGFSSLADVTEHIVGSVLGKLVKDRFNNKEIINSVTSPMLTIHGLKDELIPFQQSKLLLSMAKSRVKQYHFSDEMTHNQFDIQFDIMMPLKNFLTKIQFIESQEPLSQNRQLTRILTYQ